MRTNGLVQPEIIDWENQRVFKFGFLDANHFLSANKIYE